MDCPFFSLQVVIATQSEYKFMGTAKSQAFFSSYSGVGEGGRGGGGGGATAPPPTLGHECILQFSEINISSCSMSATVAT